MKRPLFQFVNACIFLNMRRKKTQSGDEGFSNDSPSTHLRPSKLKMLQPQTKYIWERYAHVTANVLVLQMNVRCTLQIQNNIRMGETYLLKANFFTRVEIDVKNIPQWLYSIYATSSEARINIQVFETWYFQRELDNGAAIT